MGCTVQPSPVHTYARFLIIQIEQEGWDARSKIYKPKKPPQNISAKERSYASFCSEESVIPTVICSSVITITVLSLWGTQQEEVNYDGRKVQKS